ncbi:hypothetical protein OF364_01120 [Mycoplasma enhydrae]|uniref:hypothetical protein n=1 Tax=Mycoplasma enhydrae TaxID=2499220 RepID=UPI00197C6791|nr:hypothetical protein [Mycoplasma enhydrae]MBN4089687.1 hypothetical protein [Mycoplasma enhydrae]MCV3753417.1 hypothetical protein [Mycoplasma enhydrae]
MKRKMIKILAGSLSLAAIGLPLISASCINTKKKELTEEDLKILEYKKRYIDKNNLIFDDFEDFTVNKDYIYVNRIPAIEVFPEVYKDFTVWYEDFMKKLEIFKKMLEKYLPKELNTLEITNIPFSKEVKINLNPRNYKDGEWCYSFWDKTSYNSFWKVNNQFVSFLEKISTIPNLNIDISVSGVDLEEFKFKKDIEYGMGYFSKFIFTSDYWKKSIKLKDAINYWEYPLPLNYIEFDNFLNLFNFRKKPKLLKNMKDDGYNENSHYILLKNGKEVDNSFNVWYKTFKKEYHSSHVILPEQIFIFEKNNIELKSLFKTNKFDNKDLFYQNDIEIKTFLHNNLYSHFKFQTGKNSQIEEIKNPWKK